MFNKSLHFFDNRADTNSLNIPKLRSWSNLQSFFIDLKVNILSSVPAKASFQVAI